MCPSGVPPDGKMRKKLSGRTPDSTEKTAYTLRRPPLFPSLVRRGLRGDLTILNLVPTFYVGMHAECFAFITLSPLLVFSPTVNIFLFRVVGDNTNNWIKLLFIKRRHEACDYLKNIVLGQARGFVARGNKVEACIREIKITL